MFLRYRHDSASIFITADYGCDATATTSAFAETQSATDTTQMPPIVVTAQETTRSNGLIVQADPKQPIQPVPATDGADYLQSILGFNAIKNGGTNGDVTFRGMFGSRIKMLTDGTENLGACPARMDSPTSYINPESYDRITVIKGPQTVLYATPGSAATVLFEREPEQLSADKPYRGQASVLIGSFGRLDHNIEAAVGDESKYARLNANRSVAGNYQDGNGKTVQSQWERWSTDLALGGNRLKILGLSYGEARRWRVSLSLAELWMAHNLDVKA